MAKVASGYSIDENLKKEFEEVCRSIGLTPSAVIQLLATAVVREKKIPFEIKAYTPKDKEE